VSQRQAVRNRKRRAEGGSEKGTKPGNQEGLAFCSLLLVPCLKKIGGENFVPAATGFWLQPNFALCLLHLMHESRDATVRALESGFARAGLAWTTRLERGEEPFGGTPAFEKTNHLELKLIYWSRLGAGVKPRHLLDTG
jgi:hypothetical protein